MAEIITKSNVGRQEIPTKQLAIDTAIFMEVLYGTVPESRLNDCYQEAVRTRKSTFPLKPEEMCVAWETIRQRDFYKRAPENRQIGHGLCEKCNNTGTWTRRDERGIIVAAGPCSH